MSLSVYFDPTNMNSHLLLSSGSLRSERRRASRTALGTLVTSTGVFFSVPLFGQTAPLSPPVDQAPDDETSSGDAPATENTSARPAVEGEPGQEQSAIEAVDEQRIQKLEAKVQDLEEVVSRLQGELAVSQESQAQAQAAAAKEKKSAAAPAQESGARVDAQKAGLSDRHARLPLRDTVRREHEMTPRPGNAPLDPSYADFFQLGNSGAWMKIGGYVKLDMIMDSTLTGSPPQLVTSAIYVDSQPEFGEPAAFNMHAKQSRIDLELRRATPLGALRAVYGNDFFGDPSSPAMVYRLRNLYAQIANLLVGYTWTTFFDADALPDTLDFAGPGIAAGIHQAQIRYTLSLFGEHGHLAFGLEQPEQDIGTLPADASVRLVAPDFATALRVEERWGHIQLGGLARYLSYEQSGAAGDGAFGWGLNLSTSLKTFGKDSFVANLTGGQGIGHYIQDFDPGYAAAVDSNGQLIALTSFGGLAGYLHHWSERWRSQISYGYVQLVSIAEQSSTTYDHTHYAQSNLIWTVTPQLSLGIEALYGQYVTRDQSSGEDYRGQFSVQYNFF